MIVRIDQQLALLAVSGQMDLEDARGRNPRQIVEGIEAVVVSAHKDVVDIEEDSAVGTLGDAG